MAFHARNNRTPSGAKRRWTPDDRARRDGASPAARGRSPRPLDGAPVSRAARRDATFGADRRRNDADGPRQDRRPEWYPGPRTNPRRDERAGRDRHDDGRTERPGRDESRGTRGDRPQRDDRAPRFQNERGRDDRTPRSRDERPASRFQNERQREDRAPRFQGDRQRDDRAPRFQGDRQREDRAPRFQNDRGREDRPPRSRDERPASRFQNDRQREDRAPRFQNDRQRDERAPRFQSERGHEDRTPRSRDERPAPRFQGDRQREDRAPRFRDERPRDDRATRPDRPSRSFRADAPPPKRPERRAPQHHDHPQRFDGPQRPGRQYDDARHEAWSPPEDVVLERLQGEVVTAEEVAGSTFAGLGLGEGITRVLTDLGAVTPFPIQAATIPDALAGRNVLGRGRTGSGKTIAFGAALVERLMRNWHESGRAGTGRRMGRPPRALILAPTRELALQIDRTVQPIARTVGLFTTQIVGGVPQGRQVGALAKGVDIVIGTPGRIEDLIDQGRLDLSEIEITVLDEADHMADLGFLEPMRRLLRIVPASGQRMLFSATLDAAVTTLVDEFLPDPAVHEVAEPEGGATAAHRVLLIEQGEKLTVLQALLGSAERSLVFARTRAFAEQLAEELDGVGIRAESLHGDLNQARRSRNLARFSEGRVNALVATDVAARGIHVDDIELVVHADAAEDYKTYLHRSGRTGRAGASGTVVTLINPRRRRRFAELLERAGIEADFVPVAAGEDPVAALGR